MSGDMVSEQISMPSSQGHVEDLPENQDMSEMTNVIETVTNDLPMQQMPVSNMQSGLMDSASSRVMLQHVDTSNAFIGVSDPMSYSFAPQTFSCQPSSLMDSQCSTPQLQTSVAHQYPSGGSIAAFNSSDSAQLMGKRKSPLESVLNGSASQKLDMPNKRVAQMHHRPWLEQFSPSSNRSMHLLTSSLPLKMQHVPMLTKKAVQMESVPSKAAKQMMNKKLPVPSQALKKPQNEGNESVRSKMRESLAAALALVLQQDDCIEGKKSSKAGEASNSVITQENSQSVEHAVAASIGTPAVEGSASTLSNGDEISGQKDVDGKVLLHEQCSDTQMKDANQSEQRSQFDEVFPRDVPFSNSIFANDELLQGNGLSWILEPVSDLGEATDKETDVAPNSGDGNNERTDGEKSFQDPELLATKIEMELFKLFGGVNKKYKEKGRSLLFNLKDKNNPDLRERVMSGGIPPDRLCSMTAEELASKELSQWRQAKAEEMAQMVVLRDTDIDVRRLVRKTHKGEFQVEFDSVDSGTVDVSASVSSRSRPRPKAKAKESSHPTKSSLKKDGSKDNVAKGNKETSCNITIPPNDGTDPMQGLSMDDEMKDVGFLPPIVSLDEFMESLNCEPPFESPQKDAGEETPEHEKNDTEPSERDSPKSKPEMPSIVSSPKSKSEMPSIVSSPKSKPEMSDVVSPKSKHETSNNVVSPKADAIVLSNDVVTKSENRDVVAAMKGEKIWDGILQLNTSSVVSVTGIFKSGEKTQTSEWPALVEVKGRVRLNAFSKFLQDLPKSRSRALMVMYLVCKDGISESQRGSLYEAAESYVAEERVGYAEPASGVEVYLCPPRGEMLDLLGKIISKDQLDEVKRFDIGLIGIVVWRRALASPGAAAGSRHKPRFRRQHSSGSRSSSVLQENKSSTVNVTNKTAVVGLNDERRAAASMGRTHGDGDVDGDGDDDVPPGFGPGAARDDDDLPEFNFNSSRGTVPSSQPPPPQQSRSINQVRELIHKYGKSAGAGSNRGIQPWNNNDDDDDDDDIPEWQPQAHSHPLPPPASLPPAHGYGTNGTVTTHTQPPRPPPRSGDGWWANQNGMGQLYGVPPDGARPRNRGV
ncbi:PREDICTED: uncharacterized protein LOC104799220 [Tarenaya hassleriana]|uniref:uncharacterized protein LOC104799220 n=1 Tax=Tarenaya hassleriana TaxID=28532 RepID=UPI00053C6148|nr:PREDICTED: uncharacterized protein LOC104799220 [Tarenaya hassleriana]